MGPLMLELLFFGKKKQQQLWGRSCQFAKVLRQHCFRSLGKVLWGRFILGGQKVLRKVPPRFRGWVAKRFCRRFRGGLHQDLLSFELSTFLSVGRFTLGCQRFCGRLRQGQPLLLGLSFGLISVCMTRRASHFFGAATCSINVT